MSLETYINQYRTTLGLNCDVGDTSIELASVEGLPLTGNCRILVDNEIMLATLNGTITVTVTRALEYTYQEGHGAGTTIYFILSAGSLNQSRLEQFNYDVNSNRGLNGLTGRWFRDSDGNTMGRDNGTTWDDFGWCPPHITPPILSSLTPIAYADSSASNSLYGIVRQGAAQYFYFNNFCSSSHLVGAYVREVNVDITKAWSGTVGLQANIPHTVNAYGGIGIYEASSGKFTGCAIHLDSGTLKIGIYNYTCGVTSGIANTTFVNALYETFSSTYNQHKVKFYKIIYDPTISNTTLAFFQSMDGFNWTYFYRSSFANFNSLSFPTHIGFFEDFVVAPAPYASLFPGFNIFHWSYSEP